MLEYKKFSRGGFFLFFELGLKSVPGSLITYYSVYHHLCDYLLFFGVLGINGNVQQGILSTLSSLEHVSANAITLNSAFKFLFKLLTFI